MVRRVTPAEYQRLVREAQRKQQQAINEYNRKVDQHNAGVKRAIEQQNRAIDAHNREVMRQEQERKRAIENHNRQVDAHNRKVARRQQEQKRAIDNYNREIRSYNARVQANDQRRKAEIRRLQSRPIIVQYETFHTSVMALDSAYERLEQRVQNEASDANDDLILTLPSRENANNLELMNVLLGNTPPEETAPIDLQKTEIENELRLISPDLDQRWRGALFALNPANPDAARHFCTSAREVISEILEVSALDKDVLAANSGCEVTRDGKPTRRAKFQFIMERKGINTTELSDFIEEDIKNVVGLFQVFNSATHGTAGKYQFQQLMAIKRRVEGGVLFLSKLVH